MSAEPVAVVELPKRVPYGFHAFLVTQSCNLLRLFLHFGLNLVSPVIIVCTGTNTRTSQNVRDTCEA
ncbi:hypothetical protein T459_11574 [Capsicum annuum]|uniref:Uncharacterized protein n=1 Tax=Capsicum annuum TaxID=4072 RepID=A0A2G2ZMF5_CAPAN|nr:hypothetical protein T459_11574 [Capsicum annuum]